MPSPPVFGDGTKKINRQPVRKNQITYCYFLKHLNNTHVLRALQVVSKIQYKNSTMYKKVKIVLSPGSLKYHKCKLKHSTYIKVLIVCRLLCFRGKRWRGNRWHRSHDLGTT